MKTPLQFKHFIFTLVITLFSVTGVSAQTAGSKIAGLIQTSDGKPVSWATVTIKELNLSTGTDENGAFSLGNVGAGTYTLKVTCVGTTGDEKMVTVSDDKVTNIEFVLNVSTTTLKEVKINAGKTLNTLPVKIGKAGLNPLDMPQSVGVVSSQGIQDQQVNHLGDAIRNVSRETHT